jgi:hypothetical protein
LEHIVVYDTDGSMYSMWSDELIDLYEVESSQVEVTRASHVEFDAVNRRWYVLEPDGKSLMIHTGFRTRALALDYEREEIERRLTEDKITWTS